MFPPPKEIHTIATIFHERAGEQCIIYYHGYQCKLNFKTSYGIKSIKYSNSPPQLICADVIIHQNGEATKIFLM